MLAWFGADVIKVERPGSGAFIVSSEGGMDIEGVAHDTPETIIPEIIDPALAQVGDKFFYAVKEVKVTLGGCGG